MEAGADDLEALRQEMALRIIGLVNASDKSAETATARAIDSAENVADLESLVTTVEMLVERAYRFALQWQGQSPDQEVTVSISRETPGVEELPQQLPQPSPGSEPPEGG